MTTVTLSVPDISCDHCKHSIEGAVGAIAGVDAVEVLVEPRLVELSYDEAEVDLGAIVAAIEQQGYEVAEPE